MLNFVQKIAIRKTKEKECLAYFIECSWLNEKGDGICVEM